MLDFQEDYDLKDCSTMRLEARARYFFEPETLELVLDALQFCKEHDIKIRIIGGGSNIYFRPFFDGLIMKPKLLGMVKLGGTDQQSSFLPGPTFESGKIGYEDWEVFSAEDWDETVGFFADQGLYGLENLSAIPGLVGGAPVQNIGAYGAEVKKNIIAVLGIDMETLERVEFSNADCHFAYRSSIFNTTYKGRYFITSVIFRLSTQFTPILSYPALAALSEQGPLSVYDVRDLVTRVRAAKLPDYHIVGNNGSFFKNTFVSPEFFDEFIQQHPDYPKKFIDEKSNKIKMLSGWLIEHSDAPTIVDKHFALHDRSKLVVVHKSLQGTADDLHAYADKIKNAVFVKYGVSLEIEPECI